MRGKHLKKNTTLLILSGFISLLLSQDSYEGYTLFTPGGGGGGGIITPELVLVSRPASSLPLVRASGFFIGEIFIIHHQQSSCCCHLRTDQVKTFYIEHISQLSNNQSVGNYGISN